MTTRTKQELAVAVMRRLGLIDLNKQPKANERDYIEQLYDEKLEELSLNDKVYWSSNEIPLGVFGAMVRIIAQEACTVFGKEIPTEQDENGALVAIGVRGMRMLERHMARASTGLPTATNYF